ncbi:MAG: hypothetical protein JKY22_10780 [Flavobacteriaceae bacterium]|nr:hypothetical protein [Flavobacteriaceae bacterium]
MKKQRQFLKIGINYKYHFFQLLFTPRKKLQAYENKITYYLMVAVAINENMTAQVGINTVIPQAGSILDIESANKGLWKRNGFDNYRRT